ncbi:hypothetical protein CHUAL_000573, partial [Chamberlinius hualienensis]
LNWKCSKNNSNGRPSLSSGQYGGSVFHAETLYRRSTKNHYIFLVLEKQLSAKT